MELVSITSLMARLLQIYAYHSQVPVAPILHVLSTFSLVDRRRRGSREDRNMVLINGSLNQACESGPICIFDTSLSTLLSDVFQSDTLAIHCQHTQSQLASVIYLDPVVVLSPATHLAALSLAEATFSGESLIYECLQHSGEQYSECQICLVSLN
jgi:hypothetical protein